MAKKRPPKGHIKHKKYQDKNISGLDDHKRHKKRLTPPLLTIGNMKPSSWLHERMPNIIWACVLAGNLERTKCLSLFRSAVVATKQEFEVSKDVFLTHNFLSTASNETFDKIFESILSDSEARDALSVLAILDALPDKEHWRRHLKPPEGLDALKLAIAVEKCADHQGTPATDVRWLKLIQAIVAGRMFFGEDSAERLEEYRLYPNKGDEALVAASIRAAEIAMVSQETDPDSAFHLPAPAHEEFWREAYERTDCILPDPLFPKDVANKSDLLDETIALVIKLSDHFNDTIETTGLDAKHDTSFGMALYALQGVLQSAHGKNDTLPVGRALLRTIVELRICLRYLIVRNDADLWTKFRTYGLGQGKLLFLKALNSDTLPDFLDLDAIADYVNEDVWVEFQDIELGAWAGSNTRKLAEEADLKGIYDTYYEVLSTYTHGQWLALRDCVFDVCRNPLHRFHRIPAPLLPKRSTLADSVMLANAMLADVSALYPPFANRFAWEPKYSTTGTDRPTTP